MREKYKAIRMGRESLEVVDLANEIIEEYLLQGYELTLRQLYYQFVSKDLLSNTAKSYNRLGCIINNARLCGSLDWSAIVDRTRECKVVSSWDTVSEILYSAEQAFNLNKWHKQDVQVEVWVEKEALAQIVERASKEYDMPWFCCRGYPSQSSVYGAAKRHKGYGKPVIVLHLGDHDPSGIDMTRDLQDRLHMFEADTQVKRIALNMNQVERYNPPPNPAKITDSRAIKYIAEYGEESWELDALNPTVLFDLIISNAKRYINQQAWDFVVEQQEAQRDLITKTIKSFEGE